MADTLDTPAADDGVADGLAAALAREPFVILDGGLATELEARGCDLSDPLWSARLLLDPRPLGDPVSGRAQIVAVHRAYLDAGADVVTTASYQATIPGLRARGCSEAEARALLRETVGLARIAIAEAGRPALVAASIGSYGAYLADGSEFRGGYGLSSAALVEFHRDRVVELCAAGPDLLAFETIPSAAELAAIAELLATTAGPRAWVSCSLADDDPGRSPPRIADGTALTEAVAPLLGHPRVAAIGVNCVRPDRVGPALAALAELAPGLVTVAYPNAGERWGEAGWAGERTAAERFVAHAHAWIQLGARLIGGCCRTGPAEIAALVAARRPLSRR